MNLHELDRYKLSDAVKFNARLNPKLWGKDEHLKPEVRDALMKIADDFRSSLGVTDLDLKDITLSGSNAAYTYTPNSDIDLHLVVDIPDDDVYRELFDAKKYAYNNQHNIKIGGYDVELYVQDVDQPHVTQGEYSLINNDWIQVPRRQRADVVDQNTRSKYQDLKQRIRDAIKTQDHAVMAGLMTKIKQLRQSGLDEHGEFGPENLAFKMLRTQGYIQRLVDARNAAKDQELSIDEQSRARVTYGFGNDNVDEASLADMRAAFQSELKPLADPDKEKVYRSRDEYLQAEKKKAKQQEIAKALVPVKQKPWSGGVYESADSDLSQTINQFAKSCIEYLGIKKAPEIKLHTSTDWSEQTGSFGQYEPETNVLHLATSGRHTLDILRTMAHEFTHRKQAEKETLPDDAGETGSPYEDEANAMAGRIMRHWAEKHPEMFAHVPLEEASGYIPTKKQAKDPRFVMALTKDVRPGAVGKEANKLGLQTDAQGHPALLTAKLNESLAAEFAAFAEGKSYGYGSTPLSQVPGETEDELGNQEATGPESPPEWPAGTTKIDVSDLTDWYRLGMDISDLDDAKPEDYNKGPPQTVIVFPSDEAEQGYLKQFKRLGLKTHDMDPDVEGGEDVTGKHQSKTDEDLIAESIDDMLFEINMGSKNLRREAAKTGAIAGMEFEMIVPNVEGGGGDEDLEPDYDYDQRCRSIQDAYDFFYDGDWNSRRSCDSMRDSMQNDFGEWLGEKVNEEWQSQGEEYIYQWVSDNVDESEWNPEDKSDLERTEALEEYAANVHADPMSDQYQQAYDEFREENQENWDESDWLDDADLSSMSEIADTYSMSWPHWTSPQGGEANIEDVAQEFENAIGRDVRASGNYHSGSVSRPSPTQIRYVVEPDGSLEPDDPNDQGLEFVSPPLPIDEILGDLNKVKKWAKEYGCYTNDSTGLHINISVPNYSRENLDFVKLALLMGDKYVLDAFGRSSNTYAKSALDIVKKAVRDNPDNAAKLLDKMKGNMDQLATKAIHSGITSKYTSINTKDGHIEFRSPGGDWLDQNFDQIENTLLRFTVAMSAALNPEMYRQEYLTKLYKLLSENNKGDDTIRYFSDYVAGKIPQAALRSFIKQAQLQRKIKRGETEGKKMWWKVYKEGKNAGRYGAMIEVVATSEEEAKQKAAKEWGEPLLVNTLARMDAEPLRPYVEQPDKPGSGTYELYDRRTNETIPDTEFSSRNDADVQTRLDDYINHGQHGLSTIDARLLFGARPVADSGGADQGPSANSLRPTGPGPWEIYNRATGNSAAALRVDGQPITDRGAAQRMAMGSIASVSHDRFGVRTIGTGSRANIGTQTDMENRLGLPSQSATANYAVVDRETLDPVFRFQADDRRAANRIYGEWLAATGLPSTTENYGFQEIRPGQPEEAESSLWAVRRISDDNSQPMGPTLTIRARDEQAARDQVRRDYPEYEFAWLDVQPAEDNAVPEVPMDVAQNFPDRTDGRNIDYSFRDLFGNTDQASSAPAGNSFSGQWKVMIDGEEVWRFRGVGNNQADANRIAQTWIQDQRRQGSLSPAPGADVEVLPVMV